MPRFEHGGDIYRNKINIDLSKNINPLGMPKNVKAALIAGVEQFSDYPDPYCETLRKRIAEHEGVPPENILCGNGACELIHAVCRAVKPKTGRIFPPTFSEYETALRINGGELCENNADVTFVCTPNNPTGKLTPVDRLRKLADNSKLLIIDECFIAFTGGESFVPLLRKYPNVIVLKAFTKIYALAGLRLGYAISTNTKMLREISAQIPCWSVSVPAQIAGTAALDNAEWAEETRDYVKHGREYLLSEMRKYVTTYDSDANFIFFETEKPIYEFMLSHAILIRRWSETRYRIAVSTPKNNEEFIKWLSQL